MAMLCSVNIPPTAKVIHGQDRSLVSSERPKKLGTKPAPGLQGECFIHYTTVAPYL